VAGKSLPDAAKRAASGSPSSDRGFPRAARLLRRADFDGVYQQGRRRTSRQFAVFYRANGLPLGRFGMSVKRALGGAVVRNRIRRRVREIIRLHREEIAPGWDIVIHPRSSVATAPFATLAAELIELLRSALTPPAGPR
jgi:ribonuclease P protein component